jgi:hypothetical protein
LSFAAKVDDSYWTVSSDTYKAAGVRDVSKGLRGRFEGKDAAVVLEKDELWAAWHPPGELRRFRTALWSFKKYVSELIVQGRLARDRKRVGSELPTL